MLVIDGNLRPASEVRFCTWSGLPHNMVAGIEVWILKEWARWKPYHLLQPSCGRHAMLFLLHHAHWGSQERPPVSRKREYILSSGGMGRFQESVWDKKYNVTIFFYKLWCGTVSEDWLSLFQIDKTGHSYLAYKSCVQPCRETKSLSFNGSWFLEKELQWAQVSQVFIPSQINHDLEFEPCGGQSYHTHARIIGRWGYDSRRKDNFSEPGGLTFNHQGNPEHTKAHR